MSLGSCSYLPRQLQTVEHRARQKSLSVFQLACLLESEPLSSSHPLPGRQIQGPVCQKLAMATYRAYLIALDAFESG